MSLILSSEQCRVIGVLLEKEITTPEQYPLSLNGLTNACNQKSNREPVTNLSEAEVQNILDELMLMKQVTDQGAFSGRVAKYSHRFCNTEFGSLQFSEQQRAIICVLLLRGPQTPGELRTRTNRLAQFSNVNEVETALTQLCDHQGNEFVKKLAREPGKRESRFAHLFAGKDEFTSFTKTNTDVGDFGQSDELNNSHDLVERVALLEQQVESLTAQLVDLIDQLS